MGTEKGTSNNDVLSGRVSVPPRRLKHIQYVEEGWFNDVAEC